MMVSLKWHGQMFRRVVVKIEDWSVALVSPPFKFMPPPVPHGLICRHMTERFECLLFFAIEKYSERDIPIPFHTPVINERYEIDLESPWMDQVAIEDVELAESYAGPFTRKDR